LTLKSEIPSYTHKDFHLSFLKFLFAYASSERPGPRLSWFVVTSSGARMSANRFLSFSIEPATLSDVPSLGVIFATAFATSDQFVRMKARSGMYDALILSQQALRLMLGSPENCVLKATNDATGEIIGWACWEGIGYDEPFLGDGIYESDEGRQAPSMNMVPDEIHDQASTQAAVMCAPTSNPEAISHKIDHDKPQTSDQLIVGIPTKDIEHYIDLHGVTKCMVLSTVAVSPAYQSLGVGYALLKWGTARADVDGVSCWLQSTPAGHGIYTREGFIEVGRHDVNLDAYATGPCGDAWDGKWGIYTRRYMRRPAPGFREHILGAPESD
jgi:hypothetical protein